MLYPLEGILLLCLCAVISDADCWVEVALYGQQRLTFLRCFLPFRHGVPSRDQLALVFAEVAAVSEVTNGSHLPARLLARVRHGFEAPVLRAGVGPDRMAAQKCVFTQ